MWPASSYLPTPGLVYAMQCIGKVAVSAILLCDIMNLPLPPTNFLKFNNLLLQTARETTCEETMVEVVREAVGENYEERDIAIAVGGRWQKRVFSSNNDIMNNTRVDTGKIINVDIFSTYCVCPNKINHLQN
ncbi:uncharacterized protein NPIL_212081 [Nephila pilipes]|uniref:Mutator-like transposase domain-containing protein n=1 Tax=Nephila pilipes TaxID=299642 RepID=A0A8X6K1I5_NEPPI|nr:uncharacterized protein NPIL_212081 [Nephila pilipes]